MASKVKNLVSKIPHPRRTKSRDIDADGDDAPGSSSASPISNPRSPTFGEDGCANEQDGGNDKKKSIFRKPTIFKTKKKKDEIEEDPDNQDTSKDVPPPRQINTARKVEYESLAILEDALGEEAFEYEDETEISRAEGERRIFFVWKKGPLTLQGAVDVAQDGDKIVISPGVYDDISVTVNKRIEIESDKKKRCILQNSKGPVITCDNSSMCRLQMLCLNYIGQEHGALRIVDSTVVVSECAINSHGQYGISVEGSESRPQLCKNLIVKCKGRGIMIDHGQGLINLNEICSDGAGILITGGANVEVTENKIRDVKTEGAIAVMGANTKGVIDRNEITNSIIGLFITAQARPVCTGNTISKCSTGVLISADAGGCLTENTLHHNTGTALELLGDLDTEVVNNTIKENRREGLLVANGKGANITYNQISGNSLAGISLREHRDIGLLHNTIVDNKGIGLIISPGVTGKVAGNTASGNAKGDLQASDDCPLDLPANSFDRVVEAVSS